MSEAEMELKAGDGSEFDQFARPWWMIGLPGLLLLLSLAGAAVAGYLTYTYWFDESIICAGFSSCDAVAESDYSHFGDIPVAFIGVLGYVAIAAAAAVWLLTGDRFGDLPLLAIWGMAVGGTAYSVYLTYVEIFVIEAVCIWCLTSAIIMLAILLVTTVAVLALRSQGCDEGGEA